MAHLDLDNLIALRVLGRGAMGTVFLVIDRSRSSSPPFALKVIDKNSPTAKPDADRRARWELSVLSRLSHHPFLPSLMGSAEDPSFLAYAVPFCPGGDLNALRHSLSDRIFSQCAIRFYLSEILMALSHLHSLRIVYRDLKPENILINSDGHLVLTDFDLSRHLPLAPSKSPPPPQQVPLPQPPKHRRNLTRIPFLGAADNLKHLTKAKSARVSPVGRRRSSISSPTSSGAEKSNSFVGTEEYVAPEIVRGDGHDFSVDFWALGILTYEMAFGTTPFKGKNRKETFRNVLMKKVEFVGRQRSDLTDLIGRLLEKDPTKRLGYVGGAEEVKEHPFFKGVRWDMLTDVSRPPYFATSEELDEAVRLPGGDGNGDRGFGIREYFEKIPTPVTPPLETSLSEF